MVNIWQEPWLRKQGHGYVETPMVEGLEDMTVADIVSHQNDSWNLDIINQILIPDDIIDVTHTLVPSLMADDKLKWAETNGVVYTVKRCCNLLTQSTLLHSFILNLCRCWMSQIKFEQLYHFELVEVWEKKV